MSAPWPLVGRQDELSRIAEAMGRGNAAGLVVTGPAGVGKTRLIAEALGDAPEKRFAVHRAVGTRAAGTVPLAALAHLLPDGDEREPAQVDLLRHAARNIVAGAGPRRAVVAVDDAHLLDGASAALVHHLATGSQAFVLATLREGETAPDAIRLLCRDDTIDRMPLAPLSAAEIGEALRVVLGGQLSGSVLHHLAVLSEGNPLLVRELVGSALSEGRLVRHGGLWRLTGAWLSSRTLPELVRDRLARLDPSVYAAAELVALGEPLGAAELEALLRPEVATASEREGLFVAAPSGRRQRVRLVHPLYGEALRAAITPLRARSAYRALADALAATGARRRGDVLRLALWRLEGGQHCDPDLLLRAAGEEGALFDRGVAERLAHAAQDAGGGLPARMVRVDALRWLGRAGEADALLADAEYGCQDLRQRCRVAAARADNLFYGLNRARDAERVLAETRTRVCSLAGGDGGWRVALCGELDALQAGFWFNYGRPRDAMSLAMSIIKRRGLDAPTLASAASVASVTHSWSGQSEVAAAVAERALSDISRPGRSVSFTAEELLRICRALADLYGGHFERVRQSAASRYQLALDRHADAVQGEWALVLGQLELLSGRVVTAGRWLREAAELIEQHSPTLGRYGAAAALGFWAEAAALAGAQADADAALRRVGAVVPPEGLLYYRERGRVWAAVARGELSRARRLALESADALAEVGAHTHEAIACHNAARLGAATQVADRLGMLATRLDGRLLPLYVEHAQALAMRDGAAIEDVSAKFEEVGAVLFAAEAAAAASDIHRRAARKADSIAAAERARMLAGRCEGAHTPALALAADPLPLTPRELEIATLATTGLADRDIASRLSISERTVHNHLHRAYAKLGLSRRAQLRSILR